VEGAPRGNPRAGFGNIRSFGGALGFRSRPEFTEDGMATTQTIQTEAGEKSLVNYRIEEGIAVLEMNDPPANTYTYEMMRQLDEAILRARMDESVSVLVLRGAGEKFFSAGANITMLNRVDPQYKYYFCLHANETLSRLEQTPKLVIAALNGHCVGGGLEIAMACDIRIAKKEGGKIGLPEVNLGVLPGTGGTQRLTRIVGRSRAMELMVTGRTFSFEEALEMGLVHDIYDRDNFWSDVLSYARQFCPPNKAARAVGRIKRSVQSGSEISFQEALALERELQQLLFTSEDAKEGIAAYVEKRTASFKGK
jgi:enoyl-CoA hydratase/carnithine racemase